MAKQTINIGTAPNDGTGTPLRTAFDYCNLNFTELYTAVGPSGNNIVVPGNATITGDLTVDTSTLKVDSTGNVVGIRTATPTAGYGLTIAGQNGLVLDKGATNQFLAISTRNSTQNYAVYLDQDGVGSNSWSLFDATNSQTAFRYYPGSGGSWIHYINGSTAMTLNSTGLGVGASPSYQLHVAKSQSSQTAVYIDNQQNNAAASSALTLSAYGGSWNVSVPHSATFVNPLIFKFGSTEMMRIDSAGNVGVGVTPSTWTSYKALQIGPGTAGGFLYGFTNEVGVGSSAYYNSGWKYLDSTNKPTWFSGANGVFYWQTAAAGTAGNAITFTQAMTLDASGNLLVGTTSQNGSWNTKLTLSNDSGTTKWAVGPYLGGVTNFLISAGASAGVYLNGTAATSWTSASDERLKDIIEPISNAVAKVGSLRAVIGKFKFDELNTRKPFLIAQDVQSVLPEAVDASNPDKLGVAYTDVIPLLVAAIKELTARVQTLEAK